MNILALAGELGENVVSTGLLGPGPTAPDFTPNICLSGDLILGPQVSGEIITGPQCKGELVIGPMLTGKVIDKCE